MSCQTTKSIDPRTYVYISLHTDSRSEAERKVQPVLHELVLGWEARLEGRMAEGEQRYQAALKIAAAYGYPYLSNEQIKALPIEDLLSRIRDIPADAKGNPDKVVADALLGMHTPPSLTVSAALEDYWKLTTDKTLEKSEDQMRRWRNPRIKAVRNFISVIEDKRLDAITRDDMLDFRQWWIDRIRDEGLTSGSANKDFTHLCDVIRTVDRMKRLGLNLPFGDLAIKEGAKNKRPSFSTDWITDKLLADGALSGLNPEARAILLVMINTGCRPSEIANLKPHHIRLSAEIPHIEIIGEGRQLKTENAARIIPLLGVSLEALRPFAEIGFPRYADNPGLSNTQNKYLRENHLMESDDHTVYSLRHSFETRMRKAGIDSEARRYLFGHAIDREEYGEWELDVLVEHVRKVAL
ncbi:integrase [Rhodobacter capsulatus YW1]|nr:integrase [Rhodobacter capsulatus YW1]